MSYNILYDMELFFTPVPPFTNIDFNPSMDKYSHAW